MTKNPRPHKWIRKGELAMKIKAMLLGTAMTIAPLMVCSSAIAQTASAPAESDANEIIVTANKRAENIQDVPITITAVSGEALKSAGVKSLQDLTTLVSGYVGPGDIAFQSPHLRGVGSQISSPGLENSVALYVDGVYIGATSPALLKLNNVAQVEVLKGPQGTLFGRNTTGGLIHVQTRNPSQDFEANLEGGYGNFDTVSGAAYLNAPLGERSAFNVAVQGTGAGKGWGKNLDTGGPTYKLNSEWAVRSKLDIGIGENTNFMIIGDYESHKDVGFFTKRSIPGTKISPTYTSFVTGWDANAAADARVESEAWGLAGRLTHDFGGVTLTNTLAYRDTKFNLLDFVANVAPAALDDLHFFWSTKNRQWTNELQLSSNGNGPFKWTVGAFYYNAEDINNQPGVSQRPPFGPPFDFVTNSVIKTKSIAGYGQVSYEISSGTTLTGGLRYSHDKQSVSGTFVHTPAFFSFLDAVSNLPPRSKGSVSARVSLAHKFNDDAMVYVSYNRGSKSGGFNPVQINNPPFNDERLNAYEVGTKLRFMDRKATFNLSGFYYDYQNIQVQSFRIPGPPTILNASSAKLYGLDADLQLRPTEAFTLSATMSIVHTEFGDFPNAEFYGKCGPAAPAGACSAANVAAGSSFYLFTANAKGNPLPLAPSFTGSVAANYTIPVGSGKVDLNANYAYNGGFYSTVGKELRQGSFGRLGASIQYTAQDDKFFARLWGTNLTNTQDASILNQGTGANFVALNSPRLYGITLGAKFK
jgi:iron complex outermembrane receptor protein